MQYLVIALALLLCGCGQQASSNQAAGGGDADDQAFPEFRGDAAEARAAVRTWAAKGTAAIPELRVGLSNDSMKVQARAREALSMITGQWGGDGRLLWQRSVKDAAGSDKPLMVLHLFGNFDEEFC